MLTIGTTVAATTVQEDVLRQIVGITPSYGRAVILGNADLPPEFMAAALSQGHPESEVREHFAAYVIEPRAADGSPLDPESAPEGIDPADLAYVAVHADTSPVAFHPQIGNLPTVVLAKTVSRLQFLATRESTESSLVDQFRAELEEALFAFAEQADDEVDPDFLDDGTGTTP